MLGGFGRAGRWAASRRFLRTVAPGRGALCATSVAAGLALAVGGPLGPAHCEHSGREDLREVAKAKRVLSKARRRDTQVVTEGHPDYIEGIQIWGVGIKDDPIPGEKRGKGVQYLRSHQWVYALACFIQDHYREMAAMMKYAKTISENHPGYDFRYFVNCSEGLFHRALDEGLQTHNSRDLLMMASWCLMAATEVSISPFYDRNHVRHSMEWRQEMREDFYASYLEPEVDFVEDIDSGEFERAIGKYGLSSCRFDLIPPVALERLDIHNELCRVKWQVDPGAWMREGFLISSRVDSMHRHYWSIHARDYSEDHLAHGIWNLMALYHVLVTYPEKNDLVNFRALRQARDSESAANDPEGMAAVASMSSAS